jgi:hypothetical protein
MIGFRNALTAAVLATATGCAHGVMRGSVVMKASDDEAHVCLGDKEVTAGDRVALFKNICTAGRTGGLGGRGPSGPCEKVKLGNGTVEHTLNEHYSLVKVDKGVTFEVGAIVEKL